MEAKSISSKRVIIISILAIFLSAIFAILVHAILPASVNPEKFNSILVQWLGFPAVATLYFILLFTHCAIVIRCVGLRTAASKIQLGIQFGVAYAMIYLLGMQEVVTKYALFSTWGLDFIKYQFVVGIGDGIPAFLLCLIISYFTLINNRQNEVIPTLGLKKSIGVIAILTAAILAERAIFYQIGFIESECATYPVACYVWTGLFGALMGIIYVILRPILSYGNRRTSWAIPLRFTLTIELNWIIFNSFMGLIIKGIMPQMLLRSGLDVLVLFLISAGLEKLLSWHQIRMKIPT